MIRGEVVDTEVLRMPFLHRRVDVSSNGRWSVKGKDSSGGGSNPGSNTGASAKGPEDDDTPTAFYYADVAKHNKSGNGAAAAAATAMVGSAGAAGGAATAGPGTGTMGTTKQNSEAAVTTVVPAEAAATVDPRSKYVGKVIMARTTSTNVHGEPSTNNNLPPACFWACMFSMLSG